MIAQIEFQLELSYYSDGDANPVCHIEVPSRVGKKLQFLLNSELADNDGLHSADLLLMAEDDPALKKFCQAVLTRGYELMISDWIKETAENDEVSTLEDCFDEDYELRRFRIPRAMPYEDETPTYSEYSQAYKDWVLLPGHTQEFMAERLGLDIDACLETPVIFHVQSIDIAGAPDIYRKPRHAWKI